MSRRAQRQALRARAFDNEQESSASKRRRTEDDEMQENQCVPSSPVQSSDEATDDATDDATEDTTDDVVDGDIISGRANLSSIDRFRSLDFQERFEATPEATPTLLKSPLPQLNWADSEEVWDNMLKKELIYKRDPGLFSNHPELHPRMRSILLDWLSEVCEVYHLHKETYTLAQDFIDRYLSVMKDISKTHLQLLGISSLFVAAKLEEIYPPKLSEFAYVTDAACTEKDIIKQEMIIIKALRWNLSPMTTNAWLGVFLQVANIEHITDQDLGFVFPQYSTHAFIQLSRLCDLSLMDLGSLQFRYSIISAAALYYHTSEQLVKDVSGFSWDDIYPCVKWMAPFAKAILDVGQASVMFFPTILPDDCHAIQSHNVDITLVERAWAHQAAFKEKERLSPSSLDLSAQLVGLLMPPGDAPDSPDISMSDEACNS